MANIAKIQGQLSVSRQLVLSVCEPYMKLITVRFPSIGKDTKFKLFRFGSFSFEDELYVYGTEKSQYSYSNKHKDARLPIVIAKVNNVGKRHYNELVPAGNFSSKELDVIYDAITYTLHSHQVMEKYSASHC